MGGIKKNVGKFAMACEASPYKDRIDIWINEEQSNKFIAEQLRILGAPISEKSIAKYKKVRQERITEELMKDPNVSNSIKEINQSLADTAGQLKVVDAMTHLANVIEGNAKLIEDGMNAVVVETAQDMRYVTQNLLDAVRLYGDMSLAAQKFEKIEEDPTLLKPASEGVKDVMINIFGDMDDDKKFELIDAMRGGLKNV